MERLRTQFEASLKEKLQQKSTAHMTEETVLQRAFKYFDLDNSGAVSFEEWSKAVEKIGVILSPQEKQGLFSYYDKDGSGALDYREFTSSVFGELSGAARTLASKKTLNTSEKHHAIALLNEIKQKITKRGPRGVLGLARQFSLMDDDNSGTLDLTEFVQSIKDYRVDIRDSEIALVFKLIDVDGSDFIDYREFLDALIGDMPEERHDLVMKAFHKVDISGSGFVDAEDLMQLFDATNHPEVSAGRKSKEDIVGEFIDSFGMHRSLLRRGSSVSAEEFYDYYRVVSAGIDNDKFFEYMIVNTWSLSDEPAYMRNKPWAGNESSPKKAREPMESPARTGLSLKNVAPVVQRLKKRLAERGSRGILGFARQFKIMDDDDSKSLSYGEFVKACHDFRVGIDDRDIELLFKAVDRDASGSIEYDELLRIIRGPLNSFRLSFVEQAWNILDRNSNGLIEIDDIQAIYNARQHPDVRSGKKTEEEVLTEFLDTFELHHTISDKRRRDHRITKEEFLEYYSNVSASIDDDKYFELMMTNAWNLSGSAKPAGQVDHKKQWLADHHRSQLGQPAPFGTDEQPIDWMTASRDTKKTNNAVMPAAGQPRFNAIAAEKSERQGSIKTSEQVLQEIKSKVVGRGVFGFISLMRKLKEHENYGGFEIEEFSSALSEFRLNLSTEDVRKAFNYLDVDRSGRISLDEFIGRIRGDLNNFRKQLVKQAFHKLDKSGKGSIEKEVLFNAFDPASHPDVTTGKLNEEEVLNNFVESFQGFHALQGRNSRVSEQEFIDYYACISPTIEEDAYFDLMMKNIWTFETRHRNHTRLLT